MWETDQAKIQIIYQNLDSESDLFLQTVCSDLTRWLPIFDSLGRLQSFYTQLHMVAATRKDFPGNSKVEMNHLSAMFQLHEAGLVKALWGSTCPRWSQENCSRIAISGRLWRDCRCCTMTLWPTTLTSAMSHGCPRFDLIYYINQSVLLLAMCLFYSIGISQWDLSVWNTVLVK